MILKNCFWIELLQREFPDIKSYMVGNRERKKTHRKFIMTVVRKVSWSESCGMVYDLQLSIGLSFLYFFKHIFATKINFKS